METNVKNAKVKKDGRKIQVYKLKSGGWHIFLGEKLTMAAVEANKHSETFTEDELIFETP